jgi:hypothetical protein
MKQKKMVFLMLTFMILSVASMNAQVNIGSVDDPHKGAILDLSQSGSSLGVLFPKVYLFNTKDFTLTVDEGVDAAGMIIYNNNATLAGGVGLYAWSGTEWINVNSSNTIKCVPVKARSEFSKEGNNFVFKINITAGTPNYNYTWYKEGLDAPVRTRSNISVSTDTYTNTVAGNYTCQVDNSCTDTPLIFNFTVGADGQPYEDNGNGTYTTPDGKLIVPGEGGLGTGDDKVYDPVDSDIPGIYTDDEGELVYIGADGIPGTADDDTYVIPDYPIGRQPTRFSISYPYNAYLIQGRSYPIELDFAEGSYGGKIKYLSSNPAKASIDGNGIITAVEETDAAIVLTVILEDGSLTTAAGVVVREGLQNNNPITDVLASDTEILVGTIKKVSAQAVISTGANTVYNVATMTYAITGEDNTGSTITPGGWFHAGATPGKVTLTATATNLDNNTFTKDFTVTILGTPSTEPLPYQTTTATAGKWADLEPAPAYATGDGSEANPYQISSLRQLKKLSSEIIVNGSADATYQKYFELTTDLDFTGDDSVMSLLVGSFNGSFDGKGHVIKNLNMGAPGQNNVSPFGSIYYGEVKNIGREGGTTIGESYVSGLVLTVGYNAKLTNCFNSSSINGINQTGGLIYRMNNGAVIENCYNTGDVTTTGSFAGGICAQPRKYSTDIKNCYNTGNITAASGSVGGLFGLTQELDDPSSIFRVENCFNFGNVTVTANNNRVGAIWGRLSEIIDPSTVIVINVYTSPGVVKKNTSDPVDYLIGYNNTTEQGYANSVLSSNITLKADEKYSLEYSQSPAFAAELGNAFKFANGRTPKLAWEK